MQTEGGTDGLSIRVRIRRRRAGGYALPGTEPSRELEFGGGWLQFSPLAIDDIGCFPFRPRPQLDWPDDSEHTGTLGYGNVRVRMSCSSKWKCKGRRGWLSPRSVSPSNSKVSAQVYILLSTADK